MANVGKRKPEQQKFFKSFRFWSDLCPPETFALIGKWLFCNVNKFFNPKVSKVENT